MANSTCVARKKNVFKKQVIKWKENFSFVLRWKLFEHEWNGMRNAPHTQSNGEKESLLQHEIWMWTAS